MKAILIFNLPEEQEEHRLALDGSQWYCAVDDLRNWLRDRIKHHDEPYDAVWDELFRILEDRDLTL